MSYQKAIIQENGSNAIFLTLNCVGSGRDLIESCKLLPELTQQMAQMDPGAQLASTVGFGADFWKNSGQTSPQYLKEFSEVSGRPGVAPATGGDVFIHIKSNRHDLNYELAKKVNSTFNGKAELCDETHGFTYLDQRDLTGFIDGTENPQGEERKAIALIGDENSGFENGSYVLTQKFIHNLKKWDGEVTASQEEIVGRTKNDSVSLTGDRRKPSSHISRAETHVDGVEQKIVRHSLPFGSAFAEQGLFFIAYSRNQQIFDKMLARIYGLSADEDYDKLMDYTRAISGAYFFAPSLELLKRM